MGDLGRSGELEWWKGFEELIRRNVSTIADYTKQTRATTTRLEKEVQELKDMLHTKNIELSNLQQQISKIQAKLYISGTV